MSPLACRFASLWLSISSGIVVLCGIGVCADRAVINQPFSDALEFWGLFRDNSTGLWCDSIRFDGASWCGSKNQRYSSAGTGMGLVSDCMQVELGSISRTEGQQRVSQTISTIRKSWPRENFHGFFVHFTDLFTPVGEYSTIDTAEMTAGALFAGNYFGGDVLAAAEALFSLTDWSQALSSATDPTISTTVNETTGKLQGALKPFNEYYIVADLARRQDPRTNSKASQYFDTFFGISGKPVGAEGYPKTFNYWGYELLSDHGGAVSSFIPQFCWFLSRSFHDNLYYSQTMFQNWLHADIKFWDLALTSSSTIWGKPVKGKVWGSGAGPYPGGYNADKIDDDSTLTFSAAIMAGFLGAADHDLQVNITAQLQYLYDNELCAYKSDLPSGRNAKILWRCSVKQPTWRATTADSIDLSSLILGYATLYLPENFYAKYAAAVGPAPSDSFARTAGVGQGVAVAATAFI